MSDTLYERYYSRLSFTPAPGEGNGYHPHIRGIASLGVMVGIRREQIIADIRQSTPTGKRKVPDGEITSAVDAAIQEHAGDRPPAYWNRQRHISPVAKPRHAGIRDGR